MLKHEAAEKRLKAFKVKGREKLQSEELGKLPVELRKVGRAVLDRDADGKPFKNWEKGHKVQEEARTALVTMAAKDRERVFAALFPKMAKYVAAGWDLFAQLPYTFSYDRKGFRAPTDAEAHKEARWNWLTELTEELREYDPDIVWCATWGTHVMTGYEADRLGMLLGAAIELGGPTGDEVFDILKQSATNEHEIAGMGRHVTRAMLVTSKPACWEFVEKLLLAAQRQEGLRQVILESVDEAHPTAFTRMIRLILDHNLLRFSATVRAVDTWFGMNWDALTPAVLKKTLEHTLSYLEDDEVRAKALAKGDPQSLYLALWATAFEDVHKAIPLAVKLLDDKDVERRFVGLHMLDQIALPAARKHIIKAIDDPDVRIAVHALETCVGDEDEIEKPKLDLWDKILNLISRMPEKVTEGKPLVWPWQTVELNRRAVAGKLVEHLGKRPATVLLPYLKDLESWDRGNVVEQLAKMKTWDAAVRDTLFDLVGDRDGWVREKALRALRKCSVSEADAQRVEVMLSKRGSEMRQGVLRLLIKQKPPQAVASVDRLLASKKAAQRLGALELMRQLVEKKKAVPECRERATAYRAKYPTVTEDEELHLEAILDVHRVKPTLKDALGLLDVTKLSPRVEPVKRKVTLCTPAAMEFLQALDKLIHDHRQTPITFKFYGDVEEELLGNVTYQFPDPTPRKPALADAQKNLPLYEVWKEWFETRPKKLRDADGLELLRAWAWRNADAAAKKRDLKAYGKQWGEWLAFEWAGLSPGKRKYGPIVNSLLEWFLRLYPPAAGADFLLDAVETGFAHVPDELRKRVVNLEDWSKRMRDWRANSPVDSWVQCLEGFPEHVPDAWTEAHQLRYWQLMHWRDQPAPGVARMRPDFECLLTGFAAGQANEHDLYDQILSGRAEYEDFDELRDLTRPDAKELKDVPALGPILDRVRERVLEVELKRGEMPTAATEPAKFIESLWGIDELFRLLGALGSKRFARNTYGDGRGETFTRLIEVTYPAKGDTPERFAARAKEAKLTQERLLELAFLAPQWLDGVQHALGWDGLKEGVWWFLAHMPGGRSGLGGVIDDYDDDDDDEDEDDEDRPPPVAKLSPWEKLLGERTALTTEQRRGGAVDAAWFHRIYAGLGKKHFDALAACAKYGCSGAGQKKAVRLSEVLLGKAKKSELVADIRDRKLKEPVRLLGLLPLPEGDKREEELLSRYKVLIEYQRYTRTLSPMSREDAERTATIGLENLAFTAGYADPVRLEWAMEARQLGDLAKGPVSATHAGLTVTLAITDDGLPDLTVKRGEKELKALPSAVRKESPKVAAIMERRTELKRQASRVKKSLEAMMIRGDAFAGHELRQLFGHPLLRPLLERLVILGDGIRGYPVADGQALEGHDGKREPVKKDEKLRFAHPHDLFVAGDWDRWQRHCFAAEKVQPFKQVFRELYVVSKQEKADGTVSHRYAGQQVQPRQSMALWGSRGWTAFDEVTKTFHEAGVVAEVTFQHHGWTAAQVEGHTLDGIRFRKVGEYLPMKLTDVPPRLFSEVMRDGDLVVSVAHVGGVDPEASASTVQMREALVKETCALLNITNYKIAKTHLIITGKLGTYSVHLGSGVVHRQPGGHICIVPVHAQHRGRLFLPFADDDPRTAEIISKLLLLARDHEIQDPSILEQLRS